MAWLFMPRAEDILTPDDIADSYAWVDVTAEDETAQASMVWTQIIAPSSS